MRFRGIFLPWFGFLNGSIIFFRYYQGGKISGFCSTLAEIYSFITALWILNGEDDSAGGRRAEEGARGACIAVFMRAEVINYCHRHTL